jgi:hypothetical protein
MIPANQRLDARHRRRTAGRELGLVVEGEFLLIESTAELRRRGPKVIAERFSAGTPQPLSLTGLRPYRLQELC